MCESKNKQCQPDESTYSSIISVYSKLENMQEIENLFGKLKLPENKKYMSAAVYSSFMSGTKFFFKIFSLIFFCGLIFFFFLCGLEFFFCCYRYKGCLKIRYSLAQFLKKRQIFVHIFFKY